MGTSKTKLKSTKKDVLMRDERANFRFLIVSVVLLLVAVLVSVLSFVSLVNAGQERSSIAQSSATVSEVHDLSYSDSVSSSDKHS